MPVPPRTNSTDLTVSILLIIVTVLAVGAGSLMGVFSLAFLDNCPPETCSTDAAVNASMTTVAIAALVGVAGIVTTIVRLATRKRAWPFAIGTLAVCIAVFVGGAVAYTGAVS
jgi:hypothetical protein